MCIAIGPVSQANRGPLGRLWWRIASHPLRLFVFLNLFHLLFLSLLIAFGQIPLDQYSMEVLFYQLHFGLLGPLLLALLMEYFPEWYRTSESGYPVSAMSYNLVFTGLLLMDLGIQPGSGWLLLGAGLLFLGWWLMGSHLSAMSLWARGMSAGLRKVLKLMVGVMLLLQLLHLVKLSVVLPTSVILAINSLAMVALCLLLLTVVLFYARKPATPGLL